MFQTSTLWVFAAPRFAAWPICAGANCVACLREHGSTAYKRVAEGLVKITQETAEEWRRVTFALCHQIVRTLMPLVHETVPSDVTASSRYKLAGRLQGRTSRSPSASPPGEGDSDEDIMVRSMADASALGNESAPASRVL
jgi:hypothetical protein